MLTVRLLTSLPRNAFSRSSLVWLLSLGVVALSGCGDSTGPDSHFPGLQLWSPPLAMFPGMTDTLVALRFNEPIVPEQAEWRSGDPAVVSIDARGVVTAEALGGARVWVEAHDTSDSTWIDVVEPPEGQIAFGGSPFEGDETSFLWLMSADGTGLRRVHDPGEGARAFNPDFSPDGCHLVFQARTASGGSPRLRRLDLRTGVATVVGTPGTGGVGLAGPPRWSPDGARIYFSRPATTGFELFSVSTSRHPDPDSTDLRQHSTTIQSSVAFRFDFMPGGSEIVLDGPGLEGPDADLFRFHFETEELIPVLTRPGVNDMRPAAAPTADLIAFGGERPDLLTTTTLQVLDLAGEIHSLVPDLRVQVHEGDPDGIPALSDDPAFSPDGEWIVFSWNRDSRVTTVRKLDRGFDIRINTLREVYVMRRDGGYAVRMTHFYFPTVPAWGPSCE